MRATSDFSTFKLKILLRLIFLFLFTGPSALWSQNETENSFFQKELRFTHFDITDGLSNNYVNSVAQDSLGFIWIATLSGLNRYDGRGFEIFTKDNSDLHDNYINQIYISDHGLLYLATNQGVQTYMPKMNRFEIFSRVNSTLSNSITTLTAFNDTKMAVGDYGRGIHIFDVIEEVSLKYGDSSLTSILFEKRIAALAIQGDSILWAGTYDEGLFKITFAGRNEIKQIKQVFSQRTTAIFIDSQDNAWFGTDSGLKAITPEQDTIHINKEGVNGLSDSTIKALEEDQNGLLWIGTRNGGINILDPIDLKNRSKTLKIRQFIPKNDGSSVYHRDITSLKCDASGNMWIGTGAGLDFVNLQGEFVALLNSHTNGDKVLANDRISALEQSKNKKIWIGTDGGGLDLYDPKTGNISNYSKENTDPGLSNNFIVSLLEDSEQNIWIGTYRGGLNKFNIKTGEWKHYLQGSVSEGSDVRVIFEDIDGGIWAGTNRGGFYKYEKDHDNFRYIKTLGKIDVRDIDQLKKGELWLATYGNGIKRFDTETEQYDGFSTANTDLPTNIIFNIELMDATHILLGTLNEGLIKFNIDSKTSKRFTETDGLSNNTVSSILRDPSGVYWLGTYNGINKYDPAAETIENLNNFDNIIGNEFNNGAAIIGQNKIVYMGGNNGLNIFHSDKLNEPSNLKFETVFKDLEFNNKRVSVGGTDKNALDKSIAFKDSITINYTETLFSLEFASLKYPTSDNIEYSYLLEGYNDQWIDLKNFNRINFSQVSPGNYILKLRTNPNAYFSSSKEIYIEIVPPFWKTIPAYIMYFLTAVLLIWFSLRYYTNRFRLSQSLLFEKTQRKLENDLNEERLRFYTGFSHELKTPLAMILAPVESLLMEIRKKEQVTSLRLINKNAKILLIRINKLLNFRQTEEGLNTLNLGTYDLNKKIKKWIEMYEPLAKKRGVIIKFKTDSKDKVIHFDLEKIQIVFNNLMSNALKFTNKGDFIKIKLESNELGYFLKIKDTGTGIPPAILPHIFDWYYHSKNDSTVNGNGVGLALSKRFIELHEGNISAESKMGKQTTFHVFLPILKDKKVIKNNPVINTIGDHLTLDILNEDRELKCRADLTPKDKRNLLLIIDDNPDIHEYLSSVLKEEFDILHALNGLEGIHMGAKHVPNLIISDIMMPEKSGIDLCANLKSKKETSHIPIILLSAKDSKQSIIEGYNEGADAYITKPFITAVLKARIKNLIRQRAELHKDILNADKDQEKFTSKQVKNEKKFLKKFEEIIFENLQTEGKLVEIISGEMGMSTTSLYRKIKAVTGKTTNSYIRDVKLQKALHLIKIDGLNVSQAAFEVGFKNPKYFRKIFQEKFGQLPSSFSSSNDFSHEQSNEI